MANESITVTISNQDPPVNDVWVRLEQVVPSRLSYYASARDIYKMWTAAVTGKSAQTLRPPGCPIGFAGSDIYVWLGFYAWPSSPDLVYGLSPAIGTIGPKTRIRKDKEFSLFVNNADKIDLTYYMEDTTVAWETPCYNRYGDEIPTPEITIFGNYLKFSSTVFGGLRVKGTAVGGYYVSEMILSKPLTIEELTEEESKALQEQEKEEYKSDGIMVYVPKKTTRLNGYKIENLENTVTASWLEPDGSTDTDQLRLDIPQCVKDALAMCPDMYGTIVLLCKDISLRKVYYSTCKENTIIAIWDGADPMKYCVDISGQKVVAAPMGGFGIV